MRKCFVVSPIGNEGSDVRKRADTVFKHIITPVCKECEFKAIRVDHINQADSINQTIIDMLRDADLVIADMTGHNPNAFYEMGYRACTGKPMIHLKEKSERIPFDIANIRAFDYDLQDLDAVEETKKRLIATIKAFVFTDSDNKNNEISITVDPYENVISQILPQLFSIQDQLLQIQADIHSNNAETIHAIIQATQQTAPVEDPNVSILKAMLPELLKNPQSMNTLIQISKRLKEDK